MTAKELVNKAIRFARPDRIPILFKDRDLQTTTDGDIMLFDLSIIQDNVSEWGYRWHRMDDGTMGQPEEPIIRTWDDLTTYSFPELNLSVRTKGVDQFKEEAQDRYILVSLGISGFNTYMFIRGFQNTMIDLVTECPEGMGLLDKILDFENQLITLTAQLGFDGFHFYDDWGTQDSLIVSPELWRKLLKPRYKAQIDHAHRLGLDAWFHSCGNITSIVDDFHEIGVDVINISQPNVVDIPEVGKSLRGKQCFMAPISYQTVSISGTPDEIRQEARRLYVNLGTEDGGFIGYVEDYHSLGMSEQNLSACVAAFGELCH